LSARRLRSAVCVLPENAAQTRIKFLTTRTFVAQLPVQISSTILSRVPRHGTILDRTRHRDFSLAKDLGCAYPPQSSTASHAVSFA